MATDGLDLARDLIASASRLLTASGARVEALAEYVEPPRRLGVRREPRMRALGTVWRMGVLLLGADADTHGRIWATGDITRVIEPGRPRFQSRVQELQRAYRAAAIRGDFAIGTTINHGASPIRLDESLAHAAGPLFLHDGVPKVRWSRSAADDDAIPLESYLADRVALLVDPPTGSTD